MPARYASGYRVPAEDFDAEKAILTQVEALDEIKSATGLANIDIDGEHTLTDRFTPRMLAELLELRYEEAALIYQAYGLQHEEYQALFGNAEAYEVPLIDMMLFVFDMVDRGVVTLDAEKQETMDTLRETLFSR